MIKKKKSQEGGRKRPHTMLALAPFARLAARAAPRRAAVLAARAYHPAEPEMEHSVVTLDAEGRAPVNPPSLFPQPSYLVNEAAARNRDEPSEANAQALKEAMAADDAAWAAKWKGQGIRYPLSRKVREASRA